MSRRWKGPVPERTNKKFETDSPEHIKYKDKQKANYQATASMQRERANANVARKRERNQQWVVDFMVGKKCSKCPVVDPRLLSFNHLDRNTKHANVADLVSRGARLELIIEEVSKCEIVCHNCHMLITLEQLGGSYHDKLKPTREV